MRLARSFVSDASAAEEVVQETWVAVITGISAFERRAGLKTWIFRILVNRAKTRALRDARFVPFASLGTSTPDAEPSVDGARFGEDGSWLRPAAPWEDDPETLVARHEVTSAVLEAIEALPPNQRAVVTLRDIEGLASDEVCNVLGITETNQRVLLHRARARLRQVLEDRLGRGG